MTSAGVESRTPISILADCDDAAMSADGRFVSFRSTSDTLIPLDDNSAADIFLHDRDVDGDGIFDEPGAVATVRVSTDSSGAQTGKSSGGSKLSADGTTVAFYSDSGALVDGDTNLVRDVFAHGPVLTCALHGDCIDTDPCTIDTCDTKTGECQHTPMSCPKGETCVNGTCSGECVDNIDCDDDNPCTTNLCDQVTNTCSFPPKDCSDPDPCTIDTCNSGTGACEHTPINCGAGQTCIAGQCEVDCVDASTCGDGIPCTIDTCETVQGQDICVHTPDDSACDTGLFCAAQQCDVQSGCVFDHECVSSDGNPCADAASCDEMTDTCGGCVAPSVTASGCRYLAVTAGDNGGTPMAFLVEGDCNDEGVSCVSQYVQTVCRKGVNDGLDCVNDGDCPKACEIGDRQGLLCSSELDCPPLNIGSRCQGGCTGMRFDTAPFYKTASDWGTTQVTRAQIRPSSTYHVYAECDFGGTLVRSAGAKATTWPWGDANGDDRANAIDITLTVDSVKEVISVATFEGANFWPCDVNEKVNVTDIASVVDAVKFLPFTCPAVCP